ncbi:MAG: UvrD-helicase domain-containing protein [Planctomycetes bacterium]|nr:UvrD-helicase domain-containing protein [Planctomycetota bacterium]
MDRGLNPEQRDAVETTEGPLLVLAGAGTGKTRVITHRVARLIQREVPPESILAVTFTNKAANEMRERIRAMVGPLDPGPWISTFHSLGAAILRERAPAIGYRPNYTIYDPADAIALLRVIVRDIACDGARLSPEEAFRRISWAKTAFQGPEDLEGRAASAKEAAVARAYERYLEAMAARNALDFDDLIYRTVRLLEADRKVAQAYRKRFRYILVDEYQDTNASQYRFLRALAGRKPNLCVVGDDDQSIYGFRGAQRELILRFARDFRGTKVIRLERNYRSTEPILGLANEVIGRSAARHEKNLRSVCGGGEPVLWVEAPDAEDEARWVAADIRRRRAGGGIPWRAFAILVRSSVQARPIEERLRLDSIPYAVVGGQSWFDRKEIRDLLAYFSLVANPFDEVSFLRIANFPRRGVGDVCLKTLAEVSASRGAPAPALLGSIGEIGALAPRSRAALAGLHDVLERARAELRRGSAAAMARRLLADIGYEHALRDLYDDPQVIQARWNSVLSLVASLERDVDGGDGPRAFARFLQALTLTADRNEPERGAGKDEVGLITLHSAKGLEFPFVYLAGVEEDLLPHAKAVAEGDASIEEERRLFYVGITRARKGLVLTTAKSRLVRGRPKETVPSRFLTELPPGLFEREDAGKDREPLSREDGLALFRSLRRRAPSPDPA